VRKGGLLSWQHLVDAELREKKLALARARQLVSRCETVEALLLAERARRDDEERARRGAGELPDFARERTDALLEKGIEKAGEKLATARRGEARALDALREARKRAAAIERLLDRRAERERDEAQRVEQKELDEIASRPGAALTEALR
jgi:flagellar biosynthesis chaperone FliJ